MFSQTISDVVATNWRMVCHKILQVPEDGLAFSEECRALQLITKNIYHKKPEKLPFTFAEVSYFLLMGCVHMTLHIHECIQTDVEM